MPRCTRALLATTALVTLGAARPAQAQSMDRIDTIERQIQSLQQELRSMKRDMASKDAQVRAAQQDAAEARATAAARPVPPPALAVAAPLLTRPPAQIPNIPGPTASGSPTGGPAKAPETSKGTFQLAGVTVTLGGFVAAEGVFRSKNLSADLATGFNAIPFSQSPAAHEPEFRASARQTRLSVLAFGDPAENTRVSGFVESDFLGAAPTANSNESSSYTPRLRQAFAAVDYEDPDGYGLHLLGGQAWSLITLNKVGILPRQELLPLTIDPQYNVGFTWARQAQLRGSADFLDHKLWIAASLENPQTVFSNGGLSAPASYFTGSNAVALPGGGFATVNNTGGSLNAPTVNYSEDIAPDVIVKAAYDPGWGHYEVYGLLRTMRDRVDAVGTGHNNTAIGGGGGAAAILPVLSKVDFQISGLAGYGVGRYGTGQLPDATLRPNGDIAPLPEVEALAGIVAHPAKSVDVYAYLGTEQIGRTAFLSGGKGVGYGAPQYVNTGCNTELGAATCTANTSALTEATLGYWWRPYQGDFGTLQTGAQYSWIKRNAFSGLGGAPSSVENVFLVSFRYYPFQ